MQNDPTHGSSSPHHVSQPAHIEPDQDEKKVTDNTSEADKINRTESDKETTSEDFEKFNIDKVDELEKDKETDDKQE